MKKNLIVVPKEEYKNQIPESEYCAILDLEKEVGREIPCIIQGSENNYFKIENGHINRLSLGAINHLHTLPPKLEYLTHLTAFTMTWDSGVSLPDVIFSWNKLEYLGLGNCRMLKSLEGIEKFSHLKFLLVRNCPRMESITDEFHKLHNLTALEIHLTGLYRIPSDIGKCQELQDITFSNNSIQNIPPSMGELPLLWSLSLSNNEILAIPPELGQLPLLRDLDLEKNRIYEIPATLAQIPVLEHLNISDNPISALPSNIGEFPKLQQIWMRFTAIQSFPDSFRKLDLYGFQVQGLRLNSLRNIPKVIFRDSHRMADFIPFIEVHSYPEEQKELVLQIGINQYNNEPCRELIEKLWSLIYSSEN